MKTEQIYVSRDTFKGFLIKQAFNAYFKSLFVSLGIFIRKTRTVVYTLYAHTYPQFCQKLLINKGDGTIIDSFVEVLPSQKKSLLLICKRLFFL